MGARWYDAALGLWTSADTIVPKPGNPQTLNRFSYVRGNPLRLVDPSGHCDGSPHDGENDACWEAHAEATAVLGGEFVFLSKWLLEELTRLLGWLHRGVRFSGETDTRWTSGNLTDVLGALDEVQKTLGDLTDAALGLTSGGLTFYKQRAGSSDPRSEGGEYRGGQLITLWLIAASNEHAVEVGVHELGHVVDVAAGGGSFWSLGTGNWPFGWRLLDDSSQWTCNGSPWQMGAATPYTMSGGPAEDFAETFTWYVEGGGYKDSIRDPDIHRQTALSVALSEIR